MEWKIQGGFGLCVLGQRLGIWELFPHPHLEAKIFLHHKSSLYPYNKDTQDTELQLLVLLFHFSMTSSKAGDLVENQFQPGRAPSCLFYWDFNK